MMQPHQQQEADESEEAQVRKHRYVRAEHQTRLRSTHWLQCIAAIPVLYQSVAVR